MASHRVFICDWCLLEASCDSTRGLPVEWKNCRLILGFRLQTHIIEVQEHTMPEGDDDERYDLCPACIAKAREVQKATFGIAIQELERRVNAAMSRRRADEETRQRERAQAVDGL